MRHQEIAKLRIQLREVNIEYSALVRSAGASRARKLDELKARRQKLMSLLASAAQHTARHIHADTRSANPAVQAA